MITLTFPCHDDAERPVVEQAVAFARQLRQHAAAAPDGAALTARERAAPDGGRAPFKPFVEQGALGDSREWDSLWNN